MRVLDAGHRYALRHIDGDGEEILQFVKREGPGYPGNVGHCPGTTMQENLRVLIDRALYVNAQISDVHTKAAIQHMMKAIYEFEVRAALRHNRLPPDNEIIATYGEVCVRCGHVSCGETCESKVAK